MGSFLPAFFHHKCVKRNTSLQVHLFKLNVFTSGIIVHLGVLFGMPPIHFMLIFPFSFLLIYVQQHFKVPNGLCSIIVMVWPSLLSLCPPQVWMGCYPFMFPLLIPVLLGYQRCLYCIVMYSHYIFFS